MRTEDIELKGEAIEGFERVEKIEDIILLGEDGGVRKITLHTDDSNEKIKLMRKIERQMVPGHDDFSSFYCIKIDEWNKIKNENT